MGDVLKVNEVVEFACGIPHLMKGVSGMNVSVGYDTVMYNEPLGVFAGIAPWNFPAMIPHGWMTPLCIATGNTIVLKAASFVPQSSMRLLELWQEAGLPEGVVNLVTTSRNEAEILLRHPDIKGVSFVGSTKVGKHIYATAAANGKRVQALTEAKNHAMVLRDCKLERTARGIINAYCGCAGARCMACPVVVVEDCIADELIALLKKFVGELKLGPAYEKETGMGPIMNEGHLKFITDWIQTGVDEGAELIVDGRNPVVPGYENGFFLAPTIFDRVTEEMSVGREEIFGPVLCIKKSAGFRGGACHHERKSLCERFRNLHAKRLLRAGICQEKRCGHGGNQRRDSGSPGDLRIYRTQGFFFWRSPHYGDGRRPLLHGAEERDNDLVSRRHGGVWEGGYMGRTISSMPADSK